MDRKAALDMPTAHDTDGSPAALSGTDSSLATYSPEEVATMLGTSAWWVREQARHERVAHLRLGKGRIRFSPAQVAALVDSATVEVASRQPEPGRNAAVEDPAVLGASVRSLGAHRRRLAGPDGHSVSAVDAAEHPSPTGTHMPHMR